MNWIKKKRVPLEINITDHIVMNPIANTKEWYNLSKDIKTAYNGVCRYCGGTYKFGEYLHCIHLDKDRTNNSESNLGIACRPCYRITHINNDYNGDLELYYSTIPQIDIVKKSVDFMIKYQKIPYPLDIDKNVKSLNISITEFSNILLEHNKKKLPKEMMYYKAFFTQNMYYSNTGQSWANKIIERFAKTSYNGFCDTSDDEDEDEIVENIEVYKFTDKEKEFLNNHFYKSSKECLIKNIEETIEVMKLDLAEKKYKRTEFKIKHDMITHF